MAARPPLSDEDLDRLATLIAESLLRAHGERASRRGGEGRDVWLRPPVRPEPPARSPNPPVWSGAAQSLDGVPPRSTPTSSAGRSAPSAELSNATRAAAAGPGSPPATAATG